MARYIVLPTIDPRNIPYYVVTDTSTGKGVEGYGCETRAQHRAEELNRNDTDEIRTAVPRKQE